MIQYIDENGFLVEIDETNSLYAYYAIIKLKKYVNNIKDIDSNLKIFTEEELITFVEECVSTFYNKYKNLMINYKKQ